MKNRIKILCILILITFSILPSLSLEISSYGIDGSSSNPNVNIKQRNPVIHFETVGGIVSFFEIKISSFQQGLLSSSTIWYIITTTTTLNTINNITRVECPTDVLHQETTYWFQIVVYEENNIASFDKKEGWFYTPPTSVVLKDDIDLKIDFNNPFCPKQGENTQIRYMVKNKDVVVKLYVFNISGKYIRKLAEHVALKDVVYTIDWDGKDDNGKILSQGVYFVVIQTSDLSIATSLVGIIDKR